MDSLRGKASRAFVWDLIGNYGGQISSFFISIILARLLSPNDFGLVGMSMVFIGILQIFKDFGFASALVQNENNSSLTYSSVFYLNVGIGAVLTLVLYFSAPFIGQFFENKAIIKLVRLLSITSFISSFNTVQSTILRIKLDFKILTFRDLTAQIVAGLVAVIFAYYDYGVYALVIQQVLAAIISTMLLWKITDWLPKLEFSWKEIKKLSSFSFYVFAAASVNKVIEQLDTLIIGKLFSPAMLGYFSRANSLNNLIIRNSSGSFTKVFFPALAQIKNENERFERIFLKVINMVTSIAVLLTAIFYLTGDELIIGLFGAKWKPSIPIFQILILKGLTYPISSMVVNAFMAKGKSKANFYFGNIRKVLQLVPFVFAYFYGFFPFLYANIGVAFISLFLNSLFSSISLGISFKKQLKVFLPQLIVNFILVLVIFFLLPKGFSYFWAIIKMIIFIIFNFIFLKIWNAPILEEVGLILKKLKSKLYVD